MMAQLGCDHGLHQRVPLRVQSVPVGGGVNVLVDTAMYSYIHTYIHSYILVQITCLCCAWFLLGIDTSSVRMFRHCAWCRLCDIFL